MKLKVVRTQFGKDATNGMLFIDDTFECFTLEDQYQEKKVYGETCIPEGTYKIELRTEGGFHQRYAKKFDFHKGMLHILDVPEFTWILIHIGNTDENTAGCLLVGDTQQDLDVNQNGFVGSSGNAYKKFYPKVAEALLKGEKVTIEYTKITDLLMKPLSNASTDDVILTKTVMDKLSEIKGELITLNGKIEGKKFI